MTFAVGMGALLATVYVLIPSAPGHATNGPADAMSRVPVPAEDRSPAGSVGGRLAAVRAGTVGAPPASDHGGTGCPTELKELGHLGNAVRTVAIDDDVAFVPEANRIQLIDVSDAAVAMASDRGLELPRLATIRLADRPQMIDVLDTREVPMAMAASMGRLFVAGYKSVQVYDVSQPTAPRRIVYELTGQRIVGLDAVDGRAHWVREGDFEIVEPDGVGGLRVVGALRDHALNGGWVRVADDMAYVAAFEGPEGAETAGVRAIDIADTSRPRAVGFLRLPPSPDLFDRATDLVVDGSLVYVTGLTRVHAFVRHGSEFSRIGSVELLVDGWVHRIAVDGVRGVAISGSGDLFALDLTDPTAPQVSSIEGPHIGRATFLALDPRRLWLGTTRGLRVFDVDRTGFGSLIAMAEHTGGASGDVARLSSWAMPAHLAVGDHSGVTLVHVPPGGAIRDQGGFALDHSADHLIDDGRRLHIAGSENDREVDQLTLVARTALDQGGIVRDTTDMPGRVVALSAAQDRLFVTVQAASPEALRQRHPAHPAHPAHPGGAPLDVASLGENEAMAPDVLVFDTGGDRYTHLETLEAAGTAIVVDQHVYLVQDTSLRVVRVAQPTGPTVTELTIPPFRRFVAQDGDRLYFDAAMDDMDRLVALDTREPNAPQPIPGLDGLPAGPKAVAEGCLYVLSEAGWLEAIDVSHPETPEARARLRFGVRDTEHVRLTALQGMVTFSGVGAGLFVFGAEGAMSYLPVASR